MFKLIIVCCFMLKKQTNDIFKHSDDVTISNTANNFMSHREEYFYLMIYYSFINVCNSFKTHDLADLHKNFILLDNDFKQLYAH